MKGIWIWFQKIVVGASVISWWRVYDMAQDRGWFVRVLAFLFLLYVLWLCWVGTDVTNRATAKLPPDADPR